MFMLQKFCTDVHLCISVKKQLRQCFSIVPEVIAMAFSILWLSWVWAGVRSLSHTAFIYYTERQTGGEPRKHDLDEDRQKKYLVHWIPRAIFL